MNIYIYIHQRACATGVPGVCLSCLFSRCLFRMLFFCVFTVGVLTIGLLFSVSYTDGLVLSVLKVAPYFPRDASAT